MLQHDQLANYYHTTYMLKQHHKWDITELENMLPWERQIYITMLQREIENETERMKTEEAIKKHARK